MARALALTSGKSPSVKTISSDVFPQPPSPTRTTLTDRAPCRASSPAAWAAFIAGRQRGRPGCAEAGRGAGRRGWNVEGAGRQEEVSAGRGARGGRGGQRPAGRPGERPEPGSRRRAGRRGVASGLEWGRGSPSLPSHSATYENFLEHLLCAPAGTPGGWGEPRLSLCILRGGGETSSWTVTVCAGVWTGKEEGGGGRPGLPTSVWGQGLGSRCPVQVEHQQKPGLLRRGWMNE